MNFTFWATMNVRSKLSRTLLCLYYLQQKNEREKYDKPRFFSIVIKRNSLTEFDFLSHVLYKIENKIVYMTQD